MILKYGKPEDVGMSSKGIERAENVVQRLVDIGNTPSVVTLIARDGVIVSHKAFGTNGTEPGALPLTTDVLFPACSITKTITAVCVMMLVEEGLIGLKRPITDYFPVLCNDSGKRGIQVHHLLTHTSGFRDTELYIHADVMKGEIPPPCEPYENKHVHDTLYRIRNVPGVKQPGEEMSYFSFGYQMLGEIIAYVTKMPYHEFVQKRLFEPLGMKDSYFNVPEPVRSRVVKRADTATFASWLNTEGNLSSTSASGGMYLTVMDMAVFCSMLQNNGIYNGVRILSPVSIREMTRNQIPGVSSYYRGEIFPEAYWGYGFGINGTKMDGGGMFSPEAYSHWGAAGVFFCIDPVYRTIQIYFSVEKSNGIIGYDICADLFNDAALAAIEVL